MGIHTGTADEVTIHENTRRVTYDGQVGRTVSTLMRGHKSARCHMMILAFVARFILSWEQEAAVF
jgi:hypothetical protein